MTDSNTQGALRVAIAADHRGAHWKDSLVGVLNRRGHTVTDLGAGKAAGEADLLDRCAEVCRQVADGRVDRGIVLAYRGVAESVFCNKFRGIRAHLCGDREEAWIARRSADSNVLVLSVPASSPQLAERITNWWLAEPCEDSAELRRLRDRIAALEAEQDNRQAATVD